MKSGFSPYVDFRDRPIFIGACPRSGTTLLRSMLNSHPEIALPRETRFVIDAWESRTDWQHLDSDAARARLAAKIGKLKVSRANRFGVPKRQLIRQLNEAPATLGSVVGTCFKLYADATGKPRWGDKRPAYVRYLDMVFAMFPDAQFINVTRDPRAAISSIRKLNWYDGDVSPALDLWMRSVRAVDPWRSRLYPDQLIDVRYEDLVADPEAILTRLAGFLGVSPDAVPAMLDYHTHVDETAMRYHRRLAEPVNATRINAWAGVLEPGEVALVERVAGELMSRFDYEPTAGDTAPSAHSLRDYRSCRRKAARDRYKLELAELKRTVVLRQSVSARLTTGQLAVTSAPPMPPFWQRHIGKN